MILWAPYRPRGLGAVNAYGNEIGYPTTGRLVNLDQLNAGWQAVSSPPHLIADASNVAQWGGIVAANQSITSQWAANRAMYDAALATGAAPGGGGYYEPAYGAYQSTTEVPTWAQGSTTPAAQATYAQRAADQPIVDPAILAQQAAINAAAASAPVYQPAPAAASSPAAAASTQAASAGTRAASVPAPASGVPGDIAVSGGVAPASMGAGVSIPMWAWALGGVALLFFAFGGSDGR